MTTLDFWFDPGCPFTWATSRWVTKVHESTDLEVRWHPLSLSLLFATDESPMAGLQAVAIGPSRVCAAVYEAAPETLGAFYTQLGQRFHHGGDFFEESRRLPLPEVLGGYVANAGLLRVKVVDSLAALNLDPSLVDAMDDPAYDNVLRVAHDEVPSGDRTLELAGSPALSVDGGPAFFGPVSMEVPESFAAVELWQAFETLVRNPDFFEIKRMAERPAPLAGIRVGQNLL